MEPVGDDENDGIAGPDLKKVFRIPPTFSKPQKSRDPNPKNTDKNDASKSGNKGADLQTYTYLHEKRKFEYKGYRMYFPKNHERDKEKET